MATIPEAFATALQHHQAGRLPAAEQIYRQILAVEPNHVDAIHLLGVIAQQLGQHEVAVQYIRRAIGLNGNFAAFHSNLGGAYHALARFPEAVASYRRALELKPDFVESHNNLGNALRAQGKLIEAAACYLQAVELKPDFNLAHSNLGMVMKDLARLDEAVACFERAIQLQPEFAGAHSNLGNILRDQGKLDEAIICFCRALELKPDSAEAHSNLGNALKDKGKPVEAVACYRRAVELKPAFAEAHCNLGNALKDQGKLDEAIASYRRTLELKPVFAEAQNNLGLVLKEQGRLDEAVACFERALELKPVYFEVRNILGHTLRELGRLDEAAACYRQALELTPSNAAALGALIHTDQHLCCWDDLPVLTERVIEVASRTAEGGIHTAVTPFSFLALPTITTAAQQLRCSQKWVDRQPKAISGPGASRARDPAAALKSKITIGYLSADFHAHATAWLMAELIEKHDRERFSICGYSYGPDDGSPMRRRLIQAFGRFVDLKGVSFRESAQRIADDGVDILVDLKGYTQHARTQILALHPAPVQVNYLGYPGTMGASFMDYILVDEFVVPSDQQPFFTEQLVHLPGCYQVNDSQREIAAQTPSRAECGLPEQGFVFCSFNNSYKITPDMFSVWMELLKAVPGSVLWLLEGNRFVPANLFREAQVRGVAAERLVFAPRKPLPEHLARHRLADLFLDSFPYNAHTTASDALWAGCPVLTLAGETFASRVAGSLLRTVGLPELITTSREDYQAMALELARNPEMLTDLRTRLMASRETCGLFSGEQFARKIEKAFTTMWEIYTSGEQPRPFKVIP